MNPIIKKKWVDALRSGDFKQTHRKLATMDVTAEEPRMCFCALGVLCELYRRERIETDRHSAPEWAFVKDECWEGDAWYFLESSTVLPDAVAEWAFGNPDRGSPEILVSAAARWNTGKGEMLVPIMVLNDEDKMPFTKLADLIERDHTL